jgi:hypothetical protein
MIPVFYSYTVVDISKKADLVIFSYNRPLQLYALLESIKNYCTGFNEIHVIYRTDAEQFDQGYKVVTHDFCNVQYHKQSSNPQQDFKPLTLQAAFFSPSAYIMFAVDDIVVKEKIDISECIDALEQCSAYGFYLRLGKNLTNCYSYGSAAQPLPPLQEELPMIFSWHFNQGTFDWVYPHTVDMTLYRKKDIESYLRVYSYSSPNKLEDIWNLHARPIIAKKGLCYLTSKIVNVPLNRVQNDYNNRAMQQWTVLGLLEEFLGGKKIDITPLYAVHNTAAHMEYSPLFINR